MAKSGSLKLDEIREVFRIVQEAIDLGNDPVAWRQRMLERMCKLIDALWGVCFVIPIRFDPANLKPPVFVYSPIPANLQKTLTKRFLEARVEDDPLTAVIAGLADKPITRLRRQMVDDEAWYASGAFKNWRKPLGTDDIIHSHDPLPQVGVMSVMGFVRATNAKPFESREAQLVDLLREELRHRWISAEEQISSRAPLTTRHQQLLVHLKGPKSEKQIAKYMGLSPHTTHNYVKALYRRLKVNSRAELLQHPAGGDLRNSILPRIGLGEI